MSFEHLFNKNLERQAEAEESIARVLERIVELLEVIAAPPELKTLEASRRFGSRDER